MKEFLKALADHDTGQRYAEISRLKDALLRELPPGAAILDEYETRRLYSRDLPDIPPILTKMLFRTTPLLVVQPRTAEEVEAILRFASRYGVPLFPRGISSWGLGGAVPTVNGLVVDFSLMNRILELDPSNLTVEVESGARWGEIDEHLEEKNLALAVTPSSRFSTVGGWICTGGYGLNSSSYGHLKNWVESVEVVTPAGRMRVGCLDRDFDLFFGAEGQLGLLTSIKLKILPRHLESFTYLFYFDTLDSALVFMETLLAKNCIPRHLKIMDRSLIENLERIREIREGSVEKIFQIRDAILFHFDNEDDEAHFQKIRPEGQEAPQYLARLLHLERYSPMKVQVLGPSLLGSEAILPLREAKAYIAKAKTLGRRYKVDLLFEAHLVKSDRGFEILVMSMFTCDRRKILEYFLYLALVPMLTRLAVRHGGRPYGIGIWNVPFFASRFSPKEAERRVAAKRRFDPKNILNPRKYYRIHSRFMNIPAKLFHPLFFNVSMDLLLMASPLLGLALTPVGSKPEEKGSILEVSSLECTGCGNCISVCPAYRVLGHEGVAPRGKLRLAWRLASHKRIGPEEARRSFFCTYCGLCEEVCQAQIPLRQVWQEMERELEAMFGRPADEIDRFVESLGQNRSFLELIKSEPY